MAGIGNLMGILWCSLILGLAENFVLSFRGYAGGPTSFLRLIVGGDYRPLPQRQVK